GPAARATYADPPYTSIPPCLDLRPRPEAVRPGIARATKRFRRVGPSKGSDFPPAGEPDMTFLFAFAAAALTLPTIATQEPGPPAQEVAAAARTRPSPDPDAPPLASAHRAATAPAIDGLALDAIWQSAPRFHEFREFEP